MNKRILITTLSLCCSSATLADALGFRISANSWSQDYEGTVQSGPTEFDLNDDLGFDDESNSSFSIALEHPLPLLPNIMLSRTEMESTATGTITGIFDGVAYNGDVRTDGDLSHTDLTLYYELLDNWISLDFGLTIRQFEEGIKVTDLTGLASSPSSEEEFDEVLPLIYLATKFELPLSGLYVGADINAISYDDDELIDYKVNIGYETSLGFGAELGFRSFSVDYEDSATEKADLTIDGVYGGVFYHF
jgi:outer membrane protein